MTRTTSSTAKWIVENPPKYIIGNIVHLNSGGPNMTIVDMSVEQNSDGENYWEVECYWTTTDGAGETAAFPEVCVKQ